jgi:hypothetical protein
MQLGLRNTLQTGGLLLAGMLLAVTLARTPLILTDERTLLFMPIGLSPLPFLKSVIPRYFGPSITFAGVQGCWYSCGIGWNVRLVTLGASVTKVTERS